MSGFRDEPMVAPPWDDPTWIAEADAWTAAQLAQLGLSPTGPPETRARPWSIVRSLPTSGVRVHFKATAPAMANDAALTPVLAELAPGIIVRPLATDPGRRRMLLPDAGAPLREILDDEAWLRTWTALLPRFAELQVGVAPLGVALLAAGALDRRTAGVPALLEGLLAEPEWLMVGREGGLRLDEIDELRRLVPVVAAACERLEEAGIGDSIQHDDLHDGNVLLGPGGARIIDWGDAAIAHPFGTLLVTLNAIGDRLGVAPDDARLAHLRDAYLEPWAVGRPLAALRALVPLARWTAMVGRALTWRAALPYATSAELGEWGSAVPEWLRELAAEAPAA